MDLDIEQTAKILVIDRDLAIARFWQQQLLNAGYTTKLARSIGHALAQLEKERVDLTIYLFEIPPLDDLLILRKLKEAQSGMKLLVCGPAESRMVFNYLVKARVDVILNQPCTVKELIEVVGKQINRPIHPKAISTRYLT